MEWDSTVFVSIPNDAIVGNLMLSNKCSFTSTVPAKGFDSGSSVGLFGAGTTVMVAMGTLIFDAGGGGGGAFVGIDTIPGPMGIPCEEGAGADGMGFVGGAFDGGRRASCTILMYSFDEYWHLPSAMYDS